MLFNVFSLIILIILVYFFQNKSKKTANYNILDSPKLFGIKTGWFAVKTKNPRKILDFLKFEKFSESNWVNGIKQAYSGKIFISPPVTDWTFIVGNGLPNPNDNTNKIIEILASLSKEFGEAQFFYTHRYSNIGCWMKSKNGQIERIYADFNEDTFLRVGEPTEIEKELKLYNVSYSEDFDLPYPSEEMVWEVANSWSINPMLLENIKELSLSFGYLISYDDKIYRNF